MQNSFPRTLIIDEVVFRFYNETYWRLVDEGRYLYPCYESEAGVKVVVLDYGAFMVRQSLRELLEWF